jgi:ABC-type oligopeptide transport system substrate-binding subunit
LSYLVEYFTSLASQDAVLMLLEDLHWADDSSLDVLNHLALALTDQALMIAGTARPALFERRPHWGEGQTFHDRLPLRPLTKRNTRRLLEEILQKVADVPDTLSNLVVEGAEGNPFFVEELVKMLVEDGVIVKAEEKWEVEPTRLTEVRVPSTLTGVLQARLDRLPLQDRTILQQASVVGRLFWDRAVAHISEAAEEGIEEAEVLNTLTALRGREMVFQRETTAIAGAQEYIFKHAVLREVTYESLLKRLRKVYHGLVADWLMEQAGERAGEYTGLIADHLELAGRSPEAIEYLLEAGDRARRLYAHQEAIQAYERALTLLKEQGNHELRGRTLMKLGLTYHTAFDFARSREAYDEGFASLRLAGRTASEDTPPAPHALREVWATVRTLDPAKSSDSTSEGVIHALFRGLVELSVDGAVLPDIADRWEVSDDGCTYTFHLRDDVRWSDGTPLTAQDFEYSWKRALDPRTEAPPGGAAELLCDIKGARAFHEGRGGREGVGVQAVDPVTLRVELEGPTGYFLSLLSQETTYAVPRHVVEAHGPEWTSLAHMVSSGPFQLRDWRLGRRIVLARNPEYCGRARGNLQRVELICDYETSDLLTMYEDDLLDILPLWWLPKAEAERALERFAGEYTSRPARSTYYVGFDVRRRPFDDPRVRRALVLATDRETLSHAVRGVGFLAATGGFVSPATPGHSAGIGLSYDPKEARRLLAEGGYPGGRRFPRVEALANTGSPREALEYLEAQWRENLGIQIGWDFVDWSLFLDRSTTEDWPNLWWLGWNPDYLDPDSFLRVGFRARRAWQHEPFERLVEQARRLTDQGERMRLYGEAEKILAQEAPIMPVFYNPAPLLVKPWVKNCPGPWKDVIIEPH